MFCKVCGQESTTNDFCSVCGAPMEATPVAGKNPGKVFGIIALIAAIAALVLPVTCGCIPVVNWIVGFITPILPIVAIVFGIIGNSKSKKAGCKNTLAKVGLILGIVALALQIVGAIAAAIMFVLGYGGQLLAIFAAGM